MHQRICEASGAAGRLGSWAFLRKRLIGRFIYPLPKGLCGILGVCINSFQEMPAGHLSRISYIFAKYSYGIYLFHIPAIYIAFYKLHQVNPALQWLVLLALSIVLPWTAYHLLEAPMIGVGRRLAERFARPKISIAARKQLTT